MCIMTAVVQASSCFLIGTINSPSSDVFLGVQISCAVHSASTKLIGNYSIVAGDLIPYLVHLPVSVFDLFLTDLFLILSELPCSCT